MTVTQGQRLTCLIPFVMAPRHYHFARKHTWFVIQIIRYFVDRKVSKALPVECEESLVAFPFDARARFRTLLRLLGFQLSLMLIGRCDDENHVSEASVVWACVLPPKNILNAFPLIVGRNLCNAVYRIQKRNPPQPNHRTRVARLD